MREKNSEKGRDLKRTLSDEQIITERTFGRRSFLTSVGSIVVGGAAALALGDALEAAAQQRDRDAKNAADPDSKDAKKRTDPDAKKNSSTKTKQSDAEAQAPKKAGDSDAKKEQRSGLQESERPGSLLFFA